MFVLFLLYSFIGWISEVVYCRILDGRWTNRGFLHSPLCPVYGFGALLVTGLLKPLSGDLLLVFTAAVLLTSVLEYATAWILERLFLTRWWDYSGECCNLHGRICLKNSLLFGLMSLLGLELLHPAFTALISLIPPSRLELTARVFAVFFLLDFSLTVASLLGFSSKVAALKTMLDSIPEVLSPAQWLDEQDLRASLVRLKNRISSGLYPAESGAGKLAERLERLMERSRSMRRLLHAFPGMRSLRLDSQLAAFKRLHERIRTHRKDS